MSSTVLQYHFTDVVQASAIDLLLVLPPFEPISRLLWGSCDVSLVVGQEKIAKFEVRDVSPSYLLAVPGQMECSRCHRGSEILRVWKLNCERKKKIDFLSLVKYALLDSIPLIRQYYPTSMIFSFECENYFFNNGVQLIYLKLNHIVVPEITQ